MTYAVIEDVQRNNQDPLDYPDIHKLLIWIEVLVSKEASMIGQKYAA